jgi:hypothetical protein
MATTTEKHSETLERSVSEGKKSVDDIEKDTLPNYELPVTEEAIRTGSVAPEHILKHSHDADEALKAFASYQGEVIHIDEETNRRLLRKIDWNLMPVCHKILVASSGTAF